MKTIILFILIILTTLSGITLCGTKKELSVGDCAPNFTLVDQNGVEHTLSDMRGKKVVLYFYPKDDTPGCSAQACNIRDHYQELLDADITIWGLSGGSQASKSAFAHKYHLTYPLLSANKKILKAYGVEGGFWRLYMPKRYTFLINEEGIIVAILKNIKLNKHVQQIIDAFNSKQ